MSKWRKAMMAGVGAAVAAVAAAVWTGPDARMPETREDWVRVVGAALVAGVLAGLATYNIKNEPPAVRPVR